MGAREMYVAIPPDRDPEPVRILPTFTADLEALADSHLTPLQWAQLCRPAQPPDRLMLVGLIRAGGLLRVKSGWLELPVAKTATPLIPPLTVTAHPILLPQPDSVDLLCGLPIVKIRFAAEKNLKLEKEYPFQFCGSPGARPADWPGQPSHL